MTTGYTSFELQEPFPSSLPKLLSNDKAALTWNAGTSFPSAEQAFDGMPCFRTDQAKLYVYQNTQWVLMIDFNDLPYTQTELDGALATLIQEYDGTVPQE